VGGIIYVKDWLDPPQPQQQKQGISEWVVSQINKQNDEWI